MIDEKIEKLKLRGYAKKGAYTLKAKHPGIEFTSGLRDRGAQARAMASNVVKNRKWVQTTYRDTPIRERLQGWVDTHPEAKTQTDLQIGLLIVLQLFTDDELLVLSRHFSGEAFDVQPITQDAEQIKSDILALEGLDKFLDHEGGLVRWHAQFKREQEQT